MAAPLQLRIDPARLWSTIEETAALGGTPKGGICRLALSDEDGRARDWLAAAARRAGLDVAVDAIGSMFMTRPGRDPGRLPVAFGSHLDTQPTGGRFDGVLGVLAGLEVMRTLNDAGHQTGAPLMLVNWTNEEGARFAPGVMGSGVHAGDIELGHALGQADKAGIRVAEALARIGYAGPETVGSRRFAAMVELHIEQGPILEEAATTIGAVTAAKGAVWADAVVTGRESHAGSTPMSTRRDALTAFSAFALAVEEAARAEGPDGVATIGVAEVAPASRNTVPGSVRFTVEWRHPDAAALGRLGAAIENAAAAIGSARGVDIALDRVWSKDPVRFDPGVVAAIEEAASELGLSHRRITSGANHDAVTVAGLAPTAMVFVPCLGGVSHNEAESATPADCAAGADVLLHTILKLAG